MLFERVSNVFRFIRKIITITYIKKKQKKDPPTIFFLKIKQTMFFLKKTMIKNLLNKN